MPNFATERSAIMGSIDNETRRRRPAYRRSKVKANAEKAIALAAEIVADEAPFDPQIPGDSVGGGDPGLAEVLARRAGSIELQRP